MQTDQRFTLRAAALPWRIGERHFDKVLSIRASLKKPTAVGQRSDYSRASRMNCSASGASPPLRHSHQ